MRVRVEVDLVVQPFISLLVLLVASVLLPALLVLADVHHLVRERVVLLGPVGGEGDTQP